MITVSVATIKDIELIVPMFEAYRRFYEAEPNPEGALQFISDRISRSESRIFLAYKQETGGRIPAGFTQLYPSFSSVSMKRLWILNDLFVRPEFRRSGAGAALMEKAREFAKEDGAKGLSLATRPHNETAQALYVKMGYKLDTQFLHFNHYFQAA
ncbi:MAG TPA: GNAT family N-acetyltransferase [Fibrobacteria bacterium]|nr:GNAT family N-acetyltransferase [Fibrobacteria bacterium]